MARQRLQKLIAQAGIASRRAAEALIVEGRVRVNGKVVDTLGATADSARDRIEVDGRRIVAERLVYVVLHKPRGVVSTLRDPEGRPTVAELVARVPARLFPVGRLDFATSGVLLMTNDGELSDALLRPRRGVPKTYVVKLATHMTDAQLQRWSDGVELDDGPTRPAEVKLLRYEDGDKTWVEITLREGRNQQIRRMAEATGTRVMRLARVAFAGVECGDLRPGQWRPLTVDEMRALRKRFGVPRRVRAQPELLPQPAAPNRTERTRRGASSMPRNGTKRTARSPSRGKGKGKRTGAPRGGAGTARAARSVRSEKKPRATDRRAARGRGRGRR